MSTGDEQENTTGVSFAAVARESGTESVEHEREATEAIEEAEHGSPAGDPSEGESANDTPPIQPTISSVLGGGPVSNGDDVAI